MSTVNSYVRIINSLSERVKNAQHDMKGERIGTPRYKELFRSLERLQNQLSQISKDAYSSLSRDQYSELLRKLY
jgi:hypothetical protein